MSIRLARPLIAGLVALGLLLWHPFIPRAASSPAPLPQIQPPALTQLAFRAAGRPVIAGWPAGEAYFYGLGVPMPTAYDGALYIDPGFEQWILRMRPAILESARRHNRPKLSGMDDRQLAVVMAAILYLENNAALNDRSSTGRAITPLYQNLQTYVNELGLGTDFSILPTNLRPSVARDILIGRLPLPPNPDDSPSFYRPITVYGSALQQLQRAKPVVEGWAPSTEQVMHELTDPQLAIEYLAANLEIALYRCQYEWVPCSWITLVAWHSQGLVSPYAIKESAGASRAIARIERYLPLAVKLIYDPPRAPGPVTRSAAPIPD